MMQSIARKESIHKPNCILMFLADESARTISSWSLSPSIISKHCSWPLGNEHPDFGYSSFFGLLGYCIFQSLVISYISCFFQVTSQFKKEYIFQRVTMTFSLFVL